MSASKSYMNNVLPLCARPAQSCPTLLQAKVMAKTKAKDIPTPFVREVQTYRWDYLPIHREPRTYIRGKGEGLLPFKHAMSSNMSSFPATCIESTRHKAVQLYAGPTPERLRRMTSEFSMPVLLFCLA